MGPSARLRAASLLVLVAARAVPAPAAAAGNVLHLTVVSHNEENQPWLTDAAFYLRNRGFVRTLALEVAARGAMWNFQSDWSYLRAVEANDTAAVTADTNGKNIVRWMVEDLGFEADPHAHENRYNYADVAYLHTRLGVTPSSNVGGFLFSPPDNPQGWEQHEAGIAGSQFPAYSWRADTLWGAATAMHLGNDDRSYGVWRPASRFDFYAHDPARRLVYVGGGCSSNVLDPAGCLGGITRLLARVDGLPPGFYTANVMLPQAQLDAAMVADLVACLDALAPEVAAGRVVWSSLTATAARWRSDFGGVPFRLDCSALSDLFLTKSAALPDAVRLEWSNGAAPYTLWRATDREVAAGRTALVDEGDATTFDDPVLRDGALYFYRVD